MNNQDRKKIELMKDLLNDYKNEKLYLNILLDKLEALYRLIPSMENPWKKVFFENWENMVSVYAGALSENRKSFSIEETTLINSWIENIDKLITTLLLSYVKKPDNSVDKTAQDLDTGWILCPYCVDAWKSSSTDAMVICPKCNEGLHNPRYVENQVRKAT